MLVSDVNAARMPHYVYRAKDTALKVVEGTIEAESETAAITRLGGLGVYPLTLTELPFTQALPARPARRQIPNRALADMSRQLADLLGGGLPLFNALLLLSSQTEHRVLREVVLTVGQAVRDGQALSEAMSRHPGAFSPLFISMITAGEAGGQLDVVLNRIADVLESESEFRGRVTMALVYPLVVLALGIITIVVLLTYVVPKLALLFLESGQLLPLPTRMLLAISRALTRWWWAWGLGGLGAVGATRVLRRSPGGRAAIDRLQLQLPLLGDLVRKLQVARFTRSLGAMVGQGVPALQALEVASSSISNSLLHQAARQVSEAVRDGANLSGALEASGQFPVFVSNLVAVGEESGTLETALLKSASAYERQTDRALRVLTTVLEPLLIVVVGLIVMFIVISMLLPIFQLGLVAQ